MTYKQRDYCNTTFTPVTNTKEWLTDQWQVTNNVTLTHKDNSVNTYMLSDCTKELTSPSCDYVTIIYGTYGECMMYIISEGLEVIK